MRGSLELTDDSCEHQVKKHPALYEEADIVETLYREIRPANLKRSHFVANVFTGSIVHTWLLTIVFLPYIFVLGQESFSVVALFQEVGLFAFLCTICAQFIFHNAMHRIWAVITKIMLLVAPLFGCFSLAITVSQLPEQLIFGIRLLSDFAFGLTLGLSFAAWINLYVSFDDSIPLCIGASLAISAIAVLGLSVLPSPVSATIMMLAPLMLLLSINHFEVVSGYGKDGENISPEDGDAPIEALKRPPRRLWLSVISVGFVFGLSYGYLAINVQAIHSALLVCMLLSAAVGVALIIQYIHTKKNPGFTISLSVVLALSCLGQGLISIFQDYGLHFFFGILFVGQLLLTTIFLLQLPYIYKKLKTKKFFYQLWAAFYVSQFVGLLLRRLLLLGSVGFGFKIGSAVALVLLITTMPFAFRDNSIATAWEYLPIPQISPNLYDVSCSAIQDRFSLTPRETEIMKLVAHGRNGTFVQEKLFISKSTYQTHMRNLYKKLGIHSDQKLIDIIEEEISVQRSLQEA